jgi:hypothetical protein
VERWEDPLYRQSYKAILEGRWREHDPWDIGRYSTADKEMLRELILPCETIEKLRELRRIQISMMDPAPVRIA